MIFLRQSARGVGAAVVVAWAAGSGCGLFIPTLGSAAPLARWINPKGGGDVADKFNAIVFWTDTRNDCAQSEAGNDFGESALLSIRLPATLKDDMVIPWVTTAEVNAGRTTVPFASFLGDRLSGLTLQRQTGTVTVVKHPVAGGSPNFVVALKSADGKVNSTFVAPPLCP